MFLQFVIDSSPPVNTIAIFKHRLPKIPTNINPLVLLYGLGVGLGFAVIEVFVLM